MWHLKALSKGHVDVVTGEWVAVGPVYVCEGGRASTCISASMEEAAMGMRQMS